jgi:hypothetical protein
MVKILFHADADASLVAEVERRMLQTSPEVAYTMLRALVDYDYRVAVRKLMVRVRAINGDLFPTDVRRSGSRRPAVTIHEGPVSSPRECERCERATEGPSA